MKASFTLESSTALTFYSFYVLREGNLRRYVFPQTTILPTNEASTLGMGSL